MYTTTNQRLIRKHGTTVTLYLAGMEVTWDSTTSTVTRYPTLAGTTVATHTTVIGGGTPTVTWNCGNMQNSTVCQAPTATNANPPVPARKRYTPYGDQRGTTTFTNTDHGFLGQPEDTTGLTYLNNRYHDPQLAAFITVDPLVGNTGTPYLYANGNPATLSDPSGLDPETNMRLQDAKDRQVHGRHYYRSWYGVRRLGDAASGNPCLGDCGSYNFFYDVMAADRAASIDTNVDNAQRTEDGAALSGFTVNFEDGCSRGGDRTCEITSLVLNNEEATAHVIEECVYSEQDCVYLTATIGGIEQDMLEPAKVEPDYTLAAIDLVMVGCGLVPECTIPSAIYSVGRVIDGLAIDGRQINTYSGTVDVVVTAWALDESGQPVRVASHLVPVAYVSPESDKVMVPHAGEMTVMPFGSVDPIPASR